MQELRKRLIEEKSASKQDRWRHPGRGATLLWKAIFHGSRKWSNWEFPFNVVAVFLALVVIFVSAYACFAYFVDFTFYETAFWVSSVAIGFIMIKCWLHYLGSIYRLMEGSYSIDGYSELLTDVRNDLLKRHYGAWATSSSS